MLAIFMFLSVLTPTIRAVEGEPIQTKAVEV